MRIKVCGNTSLADAQLAADLGAWAVGVVFYPPSPRACRPDVAIAIGTALGRRCEVVGVFVNAPLERVASLAEDCHLTMLQFHGDEGPAYCEEARRRTGAKVIKAVRIRDRSSIAALGAFHVDAWLLDSDAGSAYGGSGRTFEWGIVRGAKRSVPIVLAGGLDPQNVAEAVAQVHPYAVDVASGVESSPGRKDPEKLRAFFDALAPVGHRG